MLLDSGVEIVYVGDSDLGVCCSSSAYHTITTPLTTSSVHCIIADFLHSFACERSYNCSALVLLEFTIKDSVLPLSTGYTPFYVGSSQYHHSPLTPSAAPARSCEAAAHHMGCVSLHDC